MAIIEAYTDIEQSRKLVEFLPIESADMYYYSYMSIGEPFYMNYPNVIEDRQKLAKNDIPCWSLAALLSVLPKIINNETLFIETSAVLWHIGYRNVYTARADNPVDACYEMIIHLHELNLL